MKIFTRFLVVVLTIGLILGALNTAALAQSGDTSQVRFMHGIPAASAIDIYTDGQLSVRDLAFGDASGYITVPAGEHTLIATSAGLTTVLWQQNITAGADKAQTLIAAPTAPMGFLTFQDNLSPVVMGNTRLVVIHAIPDGPGVDVMQARGDRIIENLQPNQASGSFDVPAFVYELAAVKTDDSLDNALIPAQSYALSGGTSYMLVVFGTAASPSTRLLAAPTTSVDAGGYVRFVHGVAGASPVDVYLNDTLIVPSLAFGESTAHLSLSAGDYTASVRVGGQELVSANLDIQPDGAGTVIAMGTPDNVTVSLFPDEISGINAGQAVANLINTIPGESTVTVTLADGTLLGKDVAFGEASGSITLEPSQQIPTATLTIGGQQGTIELPAQTFYGGVYYDVIALSGTAFTPPTVIFAPTGLAQGIASAPGAAEAGLALAQPVVIEQPIEAASPVPTEVAQVVEVTAAPTIQPVPTQAVATPEGPTARVMVNADTNLQLRQYPRIDALSLGGAPAGSILLVNGREGPEELLEDVTPDPTLPEWVDPASLLEDEKEDLIPEETWLNVVYSTPDGGTITAWVNALYVEVRDDRDALQRLADLPLVPSNTYGVAKNTAITPPPILEDRVTVTVFNLDPSANLNIRRTPETLGERLAGVPNGTVLEFLGLGESGDWAYVRYAPAEGGVITGWVSTGYIEYYFNDRKVDLEELDQRGFLVMIDDNLETFDEQYRGTVGGGAAPAPVPTRNPIKDVYIAAPLVNASANLNLRRTPSQDGEVIGKIPAGTQIIVTARTDDSLWLETSFEGQDGWIAADFVEITFNGKIVEVSEVPVVTPVAEITPQPQ